jgi:hypothetical protein
MRPRCFWFFCVILVVAGSCQLQGQSSSSLKTASSQNAGKTGHAESGLDAGMVSAGVYRNKTLGFTCKIPEGWVLRTEEMNAEDDNQGRQAASENADKESQPQRTQRDTEQNKGARSSRVLLAAFSRPPEVRGEEVNASIVIAAETAATYPGLKEAVQYFEPLTEVAKAQGFTVDEEPYEIAIETKTLVRGDFHKDVGTRVMRQSTLAMLSHGYAVSFTVIAGTEDQVEELIDGLDFGPSKPPTK